MSRTPWSLAVLASLAVIAAGCGSRSASTSTTAGGAGSDTAATHEKAVRFAECMRVNGISAFPDPGASGELTIDGIANGSSVDTTSAAFTRALEACRDLEPPGFVGTQRTPAQQTVALKFALCMRSNGVPDFPDPTASGPLIDVHGAHSIPGFQAAAEKCSAIYGDDLGLRRS
jgi:hypothetical protein